MQGNNMFMTASVSECRAEISGLPMKVGGLNQN